MKLARKKARPRTGDFYALVFNSLLILMAVFGAHSLSIAYDTAAPDSRLTTEVLSDTRKIIDRSLSGLASNTDDKRANWANRVKRELIEQDLSAARGFLLAAPSMLNADDVRSLEAAAESEPYGSADQRLVRAALLFLPNDVRRQYETLIDPPDLRISLPEIASGIETDGEADTASDPDEAAAPDATLTSGPPESNVPDEPAFERNTAFSILGTQDDLVTNSQRWIAQDPVDTFVLRLAGLAHLATQDSSALPEGTMPDDITQAASILKSAKRAGRLEQAYLDLLGDRLEIALPQDELLERLNSALNVIAPRRELVAPVMMAFKESVRQDALGPLFEDFRLISEIATDTSPTGAMFLLEQATNRDDVLRARRIARAGSDRAVALVKEIGPDALVLFENHVKWSNRLVILIMMLAAGGLALIWTVISAMGAIFSYDPVIAVSRYRREH